MKVSSTINVITNSSSEIFLIKDVKEIKEKLLDYRDSLIGFLKTSEMVGDISVYRSGVSSWCECLDPGYSIVSIDREMVDVIKYLKSNYQVLQDLNNDSSGPYTTMRERWARKRILEMKKLMDSRSPKRKIEIQKRINYLKKAYGIENTV